MNTSPNYSEFSNPELVAIYDSINSIDEYKDFYLEKAKQFNVTSVIDIGCGTGLLSYEFAKIGCKVLGVEPSEQMLEVASLRTGCENVQWIEGSADLLESSIADFTVMTGHVAQFFLDDEDWLMNLSAINSALVNGGHLVFESRNPIVQPWWDDSVDIHIDWPSSESRRMVEVGSIGKVEWWMAFLKATGDRVLYENHYQFTKTNKKLVSVNELRFRTQEEIIKSLIETGFRVESIYGDWDKTLATQKTPEMIFVAVKN